MAKNKKDLDLAESSKLNRISGGTNAIFNIIFILLALVCIIPVFFVFMISVSSEESIAQSGLSFYSGSIFTGCL